MPSNISGKKIAILATDGFEQVELTEPRKALDQAGVTTVLIAPKDGSIKAWKTMEDKGMGRDRASGQDARPSEPARF